MKEKYFHRNSLEDDTAELIKSAGIRLCNLDQEFDAVQTGMLILDMQEYFLSPESHAFVPGGDEILPGIIALAEIFIKKERPVIMTRHLNEVENAGMMITWWKDLITEDNPFSEIIPPLQKLELPVIEKSRYDAFFSTGLEGYLRNRDVTQVVVTGVMTHLCCETTARSAFMRGFEVFFPADGTAAYNADFHRASLLNLAHGFAHITTMGSLSDAMK